MTQSEVAKALGLPTAKIAMAPAAREGVPQVPGQPAYSAKEFECDWAFATGGHLGPGAGRASLFVFASAADATAWFNAYTAQEKPPCKTITFAGGACDEISRVPDGVYPTFQAVQGAAVVWIHLIQKKLQIGTLEVLASRVFAHAAQIS